MTLGDLAISPGDIMRRLHTLEQRLAQMDGARRLENAAIGKGGIRLHSGGRVTVDPGGAVQVGDIEITQNNIDFQDGGTATFREGALKVLNATGQVVVQVGLLPDGTYGLAAVDPTSGALVKLGTLAFEHSSALISTTESRSLTSFGDLATVGPSVTFTVGNSGVALITVSCDIFSVGGTGQVSGGVMGFQITGASSQSPSQDRSFVVAASAGIGGTGGIAIEGAAARQVRVSGLNPGTHTATAKYKAATAGVDASFSDRLISVSAY